MLYGTKKKEKVITYFFLSDDYFTLLFNGFFFFLSFHSDRAVQQLLFECTKANSARVRVSVLKSGPATRFLRIRRDSRSFILPPTFPARFISLLFLSLYIHNGLFHFSARLLPTFAPTVLLLLLLLHSVWKPTAMSHFFFFHFLFVILTSGPRGDVLTDFQRRGGEMNEKNERKLAGKKNTLNGS